ncbi:MAG: 3'-5' exonuclease [Clostridia bacterium]
MKIIKIRKRRFRSSQPIGENEDVVRIMSIHKSKGLEFPVVFLSCTGSGFNMMDRNSDILLHQKIGIGVKYIHYDRQIKYDTISKLALREKLLEENYRKKCVYYMLR